MSLISIISIITSTYNSIYYSSISISDHPWRLGKKDPFSLSTLFLHTEPSTLLLSFQAPMMIDLSLSFFLCPLHWVPTPHSPTVSRVSDMFSQSQTCRKWNDNDNHHRHIVDIQHGIEPKSGSPDSHRYNVEFRNYYIRILFVKKNTTIFYGEFFEKHPKT